MSALLRKEIRLSSLPLTWLFISFGIMTLIPGYPILCSVFFITLGIYQSFQSAREANDILYSSLLPVAKNDVVKGKLLAPGENGHLGPGENGHFQSNNGFPNIGTIRR